MKREKGKVSSFLINLARVAEPRRLVQSFIIPPENKKTKNVLQN